MQMGAQSAGCAIGVHRNAAKMCDHNSSQCQQLSSPRPANKLRTRGTGGSNNCKPISRLISQVMVISG